MIIALDIDGTIIKSDSFVYRMLNACPVKFLGLSKKSSKIIDKNKHYKKTLLNKVLPCLNPKYFYEIYGATQVINGLQKTNFIILLSSRPANVKSLLYVTNKTLENIALHYDMLIMGVKNKEQFCRQNKIDIFIDNNPTTCTSVNKLCKNTTLCMTVGRKRAKNPGIVHISSWGEVQEYLYYFTNAYETGALLDDNARQQIKQDITLNMQDIKQNEK